MTRSLVSLVIAAGVAGGASSFAHAAVLIDNFSTTQNLQAGPGGINPSVADGGVATGANAVGGARYAAVTRSAGAGSSRLNINSPVADVMGFGNDESANATLLLLWDGNSNSIIDHAMNADLTTGGNSLIRIASRSDLIVGAVLTIFSGAGNSSTINFNTPGGGTALPFTVADLPFASFSLASGTGANFANVTAITLSLAGPPSFDAQFDFIEANVPTPGAGALALLGTTALLRRRKR